MATASTITATTTRIMTPINTPLLDELELPVDAVPLAGGGLGAVVGTVVVMGDILP